VPPVLIACPVTGDLVPTGETVASLEELQGEHLLIACSDCGRDHEWTRAEVVFAAELTERATRKGG
jgi:hypothetical protein